MNTADVSALDDAGRLALAKQLADNIRNSLPKHLHAGAFTLKSKLPFKATSLREVLIHRISELTDAAIELFESHRLVPAFVVTRAVVETAAFIYCLYEKVSMFLGTHEENALDEFLMKAMLGSRDRSTPLGSYNVLTAVNRMDKQFKGFRAIYDTLCEFTHPNWAGALGAYGKLDTNTYILHLGKEQTEPPISSAMNPLICSLVVFQDYYNDLAAKLRVLNQFYEDRK